jgi:hypothetical protein
MANSDSSAAGVYFNWKVPMAAENPANVIGSPPGLSSPSSPFLTAVDLFIDQHPELPRRLAQ